MRPRRRAHRGVGASPLPPGTLPKTSPECRMDDCSSASSVIMSSAEVSVKASRKGRPMTGGGPVFCTWRVLVSDDCLLYLSFFLEREGGSTFDHTHGGQRRSRRRSRYRHRHVLFKFSDPDSDSVEYLSPPSTQLNSIQFNSIQLNNNNGKQTPYINPSLCISSSAQPAGKSRTPG